jgi:retinol dehydrogenase 12
MQGKVCVITGATSGIGLVAAERLAALGARLLLVARDKGRGEAAFAQIQARAPGTAMRIVYGDLSRLSEMSRLGSEIAALEPRIDVLINNAGAMFAERGVTADGLERTFAVNHMAYFVLTNRLTPSLVAASQARIVNTASAAHHRATGLDFDDLQSERGYHYFTVYGRSKLANILFTHELARRLAGSGVTANCLHPGFVATRFGNNNRGIFRFGIGIAKLFAITPEKGAETIVYLASSPEVAAVSGVYFAECRPGRLSQAAQDDAAARRLWDESARIAKLPG